ncbi:hypothetical protein M0R88_14275 [Halorussus gelatinilyticus]|uniref:Uncharacterized protein n=1 Tax=Halorussus gelatinilyticus TaxID=2937524 RepID=A0A8U0IH94_9EURY|nr:hypothetical protein [Halorussus gelatinilyticus]UPV99673.1 hypothetical protein M0R88_14275 [Halorussus gelatinilyticus]
MSDTTTLIALIATLVVLAGGVAFGATGSLTAGTADSVGQETTQTTTTTTAEGEATTTLPAEARSGATDEGTTTAADGRTTAADNGTTTAGNATQTTAQAGGQQGATNVTARNVTIERLVLRNVTVLDTNIGELTVQHESGGNTTNRTYSDVSIRRIETTGNVTDLTLTNVSINNEALATALVGESGRLRIETRLVMDEAVLRNQTVNGLEIEQATVRASAAANVSVTTDAGTGNASGTQTDGQPAISAESAVVEEANLTALNVSGVSTGAETAQANQTATETTETTQTTAQATQTTAAASGTAQTTAAADETTETQTTPAEARSGATDEGTATTETNQTDRN